MKNIKKIKVGEVVNTHGIKGELRIMSGSRFSNNDFQSDFKKVFINEKEYSVTSYRFHKKFHQVFLKGFNNINDVLFLKGLSVFVDSSDCNQENIDNLIGKEVYREGELIGKVEKISHTTIYKLIVLDNGDMIPITGHFIQEITERKIEVKNL